MMVMNLFLLIFRLNCWIVFSCWLFMVKCLCIWWKLISGVFVVGVVNVFMCVFSVWCVF